MTSRWSFPVRIAAALAAAAGAVLLCAPPAEVPACREAFSARGLACAEIGRIDGTGRLAVMSGTRGIPVLDLTRDRVTGLGPPASTGVTG